MGSKIISLEPKQFLKLAFNDGNHIRTMGFVISQGWLSTLTNHILNYTLVDMITYNYSNCLTTYASASTHGAKIIEVDSMQWGLKSCLSMHSTKKLSYKQEEAILEPHGVRKGL